MNVTHLCVAPNAQLVAASGLSSDRLQISRQQVHERGFACSVGAHNGHARDHVNSKVDILEAKVISAANTKMTA